MENEAREYIELLIKQIKRQIEQVQGCHKKVLPILVRSLKNDINTLEANIKASESKPETTKDSKLNLPGVSNWVAVKDSMPDNCDQVFVRYENGKYGINEWWESDNCWKYAFDSMIVKEWCKPPCY